MPRTRIRGFPVSVSIPEPKADDASPDSPLLRLWPTPHSAFSARAENSSDRSSTLSAFATQYRDFIYLRDTGVEVDGLEVMVFSQEDADFYGFELHGHVELVHSPRSHLHLGLTYDQVRANLRASGEPLPRIPPRSALLALVYLAQRWEARIEGRWVDEQLRVADHEQPTPDYAMLGASLGYKIFAGTVLHELVLKGTNLTDEAAYNHVSFIKYQAPLPGRNIALLYRLLF